MFINSSLSAIKKMASRIQKSKTSPPHMLIVLLATALVLIKHATGDSAQEKQRCAEELTGVATCLPYLGGDAKAPAPDCCSGLIQAIKINKKCICIILKDRDDPDLGLKINITIAVGLLSLCKAPDNLSECPALLHLDPKSPEAQAFNQLGQNTNGGSISPSPPPSGTEGSSQNGTNQGIDQTATAKNGAPCKGKRFLESFVTLAGILIIWLF